MRIVFCEDEAILIADTISKFSEEDREGILGRLKSLEETGSGADSGQCALLGVNGECSIYEGRPMTCRAYHSTSATMCRAKLERGTNISDYTKLAFPSDTAVLQSYWSALGVRNNQYMYEMNTFLKRMLFSKGRLAAWSAGDLIDERDIATFVPKNTDIRKRKTIPLVLIEDRIASQEFIIEDQSEKQSFLKKLAKFLKKR